MKNIDEKNLENVSGGTFTILSMNDEQQSKGLDKKDVDEKLLDKITGGTFTFLSMDDEQQSKDTDEKDVGEKLHDMLSGGDRCAESPARVGYDHGKRGQAKVRKV